MAAYDYLRDYLVEERLRTEPTPPFQIPFSETPLRRRNTQAFYALTLPIGAKICGPPAIDREFKTIDFLTLLDMQSLHSQSPQPIPPKILIRGFTNHRAGYFLRLASSLCLPAGSGFRERLPLHRREFPQRIL